jgi:hypothetical protein
MGLLIPGMGKGSGILLQPGSQPHLMPWD